MADLSKSRTGKTSAPVKAGNFAGCEPEFVRVPDVQRMAGIKRGLCYRKIADGTFRSVLLREPGNVQGVRLIFWPSVKAYLHELMTEQAQAVPPSPPKSEFVRRPAGCAAKSASARKAKEGGAL